MVVAAWGLLDPGNARQRLDWYLQDQMLQNRTPVPLHEDILLVLEDGDAASLLGKTDARHRRARALRQLSRLGARTVLFDYLLLDQSSDVSFLDDEALFDGLPAATFRADPEQDWSRFYTEDELQKAAFDRLSWQDGDTSRPRTVIPFHFQDRLDSNRTKLVGQMTKVLAQPGPTPTPSELATILDRPEKAIRPNYKFALQRAAQQIAGSREKVVAVMNDPARKPLQWHVKYHRGRRSMLQQLALEDSFPARAVGTPLEDRELSLPLSDFSGFAVLGFGEVKEDRDSTLRGLGLVRDWLPGDEQSGEHRVLVHQGLAAFLLHVRRRIDDLKRDPDGHRLTLPTNPGTLVPLDRHGRLMINWHITDGAEWDTQLERSQQQVRLDDLFQLARYDQEINENRSRIREVIVRLDQDMQLELEAREADQAITTTILEGENPDKALSTFHDQLVPRFLDHSRVRERLSQATGKKTGTDPVREDLQRVQHWQAKTKQQVAERARSEEELRERVRDKLCLVGQVSTGSTDLHTTPIGKLPGIIVNAATVNTLLTRRFLVPVSTSWTLLITAAVMTVVAMLFVRLNVVLATLAVVPLLLLVLAGHLAALEWDGRLSNPVLPLAGVLGCFVSITTRRWWQDNRERRRVRRAFEFYLHPTVVEKVSAHPEELQLGGAATELSILFSDIRSFTSIAERLRDEELTRLLNEYLTSMTNIVFDNSGTVDKYIGDAIMAFYGAPVASEAHPQQACRTALQMSARLDQLRDGWRQRGLPAIRIGVGINTDTVRVGNFGSTVRFDYTVIGDGVNLASRLEGANKQYGTEILVSESTWELVRDGFATRELDLIQVKGRQRPTRIFELLAEHPLDESLASRIERFGSALACYRGQDFATAREGFEALDAEQPGDMPVEMYIDRCTHFLQAPPGESWDGVFVMTAK